ncbi:hypothetical protein ACRJ4W_08175 [Streptomyces sp. GLT-R25]
MSDNRSSAPAEATGPVGPAEPVEPEELKESKEPVSAATLSADSVAPDAKKPVRRGRIAALVGAGLLVAAVVAGTGYTVVTVNDADRDSGAPVWDFPREKTDDKQPAAATGLAGLLVPYGEDDWGRGPDLNEYGHDARLSGAQATALRKESLP